MSSAGFIVKVTIAAMAGLRERLLRRTPACGRLLRLVHGGDGAQQARLR